MPHDHLNAEHCTQIEFEYLHRSSKQSLGTFINAHLNLHEKENGDDTMTHYPVCTILSDLKLYSAVVTFIA